MNDATPGLIADIGGTNARFALVAHGGEPRDPLVLRCTDYAGPAEAAAAYLGRIAPAVRPRRAAFAVASPVTGDRVEMTNHVWAFSIEQVRRGLGLDDLKVVNDFTAVSLCVPQLSEQHCVAVGGGAAAPAVPIGVIGPGTGLGVSGLIPGKAGWVALATEGGHATMAAVTEREDAVIAWLRGLFDHVSAERVVSGPGLINLYSAIASLDGSQIEMLSPATVTGRALAGTCPYCREAMEMFFAMLGTVAGNLALSLGARGGIYIAGGIIPKLLEPFRASPFRARFEAKGRFRDYLAAIPVRVITHPFPAFLGLTGLVHGAD